MVSDTKDPAGCRICDYWGADIRINGCGCHVHARCVPLAFMRTKEDWECRPCPCCNTPVTGLYLKPLSFDDLEDSVRLRKAEALKKNKNQPWDENDAEIEARYLVFSQGRNTVSSTLSDTENARTGRWTEDEVAFVDHLVQAFDKGELPLAEGVKLSSFLGDILLCKASRLTKKMKNAKLSTRSFEVTKTPRSHPSKEDSQVFSALQDRFIASIPTKVAQLELKFNLVKQWRTYFSNLCIQTGFQGLDAHDWICSVEEIERRASKTEEQMRIVRRKRMGLGSSNGNTTAHQRPFKQARRESSLQEIAAKPISASSSESALGMNVSCSPQQNISTLQHQAFGDDLDTAFLTLYDQDGGEDLHKSSNGDKGVLDLPKTPPAHASSFLEAISRLMESSQLPFQHADVWVPSFTHGTGDKVQLLHAGHATRRDQDGVVIEVLNNFAEFSKSFTFSPNHGLPGRVYSSGKAQWEFQLYDPSVFPRYKGARAYGLQTATAIPISTPGVGRMVVVFYSSSKVPEDQLLVCECANKLTSYAPTPKWKLVIEIGNPKPPIQANPSMTEVSASKDKEEQPLVVSEIISLLGNELAAASKANPSPQDLSPQMMGMRLLLLKSAPSRSASEKDLVEILEGSYKGYAKDNRRSQSELARLLVSEYMCLTSPATAALDASSSMHQGGGSPLLSHQHQPRMSPVQMDQAPSMSPAKVYSSTQLKIPSASLPPLMFGMSGPPTRLPTSNNGLSRSRPSNSMRRTVSLPDQAYNEQPPSF